jgi:hypothetical protein
VPTPRACACLDGCQGAGVPCDAAQPVACLEPLHPLQPTHSPTTLEWQTVEDGRVGAILRTPRTSSDTGPEPVLHKAAGGSSAQGILDFVSLESHSASTYCPRGQALGYACRMCKRVTVPRFLHAKTTGHIEKSGETCSYGHGQWEEKVLWVQNEGYLHPLVGQAGGLPGGIGISANT